MTDFINQSYTLPNVFSYNEQNRVKGILNPDGSEYTLPLPMGLNGLIYGDSILMRDGLTASGVTVAAVAGGDVTLTSAGNTSPIGERYRLYNQADKEVGSTHAVVVQNTGAQVKLRFPFNVTGRVSASTQYVRDDALSDVGIANFARTLLAKQGRFIEYDNYAIGGATTTELIEHLAYLPDLSDYQFVIELSGINDITSTDDENDIIPNKELIYNFFLDRGLTVIAGTVMPVMSGDARATPAKIAAIVALNDWIRKKVSSEPNMILWDAYAAVKDPATDYGLSGYLEASGVHPLVLGAEALGAALVNDAGTVFPRNGVRRDTDGVNYGYDRPNIISENLVTNPEFAGSGGSTSGSTWVGSAPDNWVGLQTGGTSTITTSARADGLGNWLELKKAATGANDTYFYQNVLPNLSVGKKYIVGARIKTLVPNTGAYERFYLETTVNGVTRRHVALFNYFSYANGGRPIAVGNEYEICSRPFELEIGMTAANLTLNINLGASGDLTTAISEPFIYEVA